MKYDDAEFYFIDFKSDLPNEHGGRHIGVFLEWAIRRGRASAELMAQRPALLAGETSGLGLLFDDCDGKLLDTDLDDVGNAFAREAYARWCLSDFARIMGQTEDASLDDLFGADVTPLLHARLLRQWDVRYADWLRPSGVPGIAVMMERLLAPVRPVLEAAGFANIADGDSGWRRGVAVERHALFERTLARGLLRVQLTTTDVPGAFRGVQLDAYAHDDPLLDGICAEKRLDMGVASEAMDYAVIPFARLAEGWDDPMRGTVPQDNGFWIFHEAELELLAAWLAQRLRTFVLPALRELDGIDGLALAYCAHPGSASLIHQPRDPYPMLLAAEQARHPRLRQILTDTEDAIRTMAHDQRSWEQEASLGLIERIRQRACAGRR